MSLKSLTSFETVVARHSFALASVWNGIKYTAAGLGASTAGVVGYVVYQIIKISNPPPGPLPTFELIVKGEDEFIGSSESNTPNADSSLLAPPSSSPVSQETTLEVSNKEALACAAFSLLLLGGTQAIIRHRASALFQLKRQTRLLVKSSAEADPQVLKALNTAAILIRKVKKNYGMGNVHIEDARFVAENSGVVNSERLFKFLHNPQILKLSPADYIAKKYPQLKGVLNPSLNLRTTPLEESLDVNTLAYYAAIREWMVQWLIRKDSAEFRKNITSEVLSDFLLLFKRKSNKTTEHYMKLIEEFAQPANHSIT